MPVRGTPPPPTESAWKAIVDAFRMHGPGQFYRVHRQIGLGIPTIKRYYLYGRAGFYPPIRETLGAEGRTEHLTWVPKSRPDPYPDEIGGVEKVQAAEKAREERAAILAAKGHEILASRAASPASEMTQTGDIISTRTHDPIPHLAPTHADIPDTVAPSSAATQPVAPQPVVVLPPVEPGKPQQAVITAAPQEIAVALNQLAAAVQKVESHFPKALLRELQSLDLQRENTIGVSSYIRQALQGMGPVVTQVVQRMTRRAEYIALGNDDDEQRYSVRQFIDELKDLVNIGERIARTSDLLMSQQRLLMNLPQHITEARDKTASGTPDDTISKASSLATTFLEAQRTRELEAARKEKSADLDKLPLGMEGGDE